MASRIVRAPFLVGTVGGLAVAGAQGQTTNRSLAVVETNATADVTFEIHARAEDGGDEQALDSQVRKLEEAALVVQAQLDEMRIAFRKLVGDNTELKLLMAEKERTIELLTQNLAVWKTEAALFQEKWEEAHLAARASGVKLMTEGEQRLQKQLSESIRQLYDAQVERERLRGQLERLLEVTSLVLEKSADLDPQLKRLAEVQRDSAVSALQALNAQATLPSSGAVATITPPDGDSGRVIEVNKDLHLVVLNLGRAHGVAIGMPFSVMHGDVVVAQVKIVDVRDRISGALIDKTGQSVTIEVGDRVKVRMAK